MKAEVVRVLNEAAESVARGWCQGSFARDGAGHDVLSDSDAACAWCADGALMRAVSLTVNWKAYAGARQAVALLVGGDPVAWNDRPERTQAEVVAALREAAALAQQEASHAAAD